MVAGNAEWLMGSMLVRIAVRSKQVSAKCITMWALNIEGAAEVYWFHMVLLRQGKEGRRSK